MDCLEGFSLNGEDSTQVEKLDELIKLDSIKLGGGAVISTISKDDMLACGGRMHEWILNHEGLLTLRLETFCQVPRLTLEVLGSGARNGIYIRRILLKAPAPDDANNLEVVSYGYIVIRLDAFEPHVRDQILAEKTPFGRILADNNVPREVRLTGLLRADHAPIAFRDLVHPQSLQQPGVEAGLATETTFGRRTTFICSGEVAVEVLEFLNKEVLSRRRPSQLTPMIVSSGHPLVEATSPVNRK